MLDILSSYSWWLSQIFITMSTIYVLLNCKKYNVHVIVVLLFLSLCSISWYFIPVIINNILYEISYIYVCYVLVFTCYDQNKCKCMISTDEKTQEK